MRIPTLTMRSLLLWGGISWRTEAISIGPRRLRSRSLALLAWFSPFGLHCYVLHDWLLTRNTTTLLINRMGNELIACARVLLTHHLSTRPANI